MHFQPNIANSVFPENKANGLMIVGYEWGYSKKDQESDERGESEPMNVEAEHTFATKHLCHGPKALKWRYDNKIIKWFSLWGHPLSRENPSAFERSMIQTNWCDTQNNSMNGVSYFHKLTAPDQIDNFIAHVDYFKPKIILFMGSKLIEILQHPPVLERFSTIAGSTVKAPNFIKKEFDGRRFRVGFQSFERCEVVCLPHPSSARSLNDDYIALYSNEIGGLISKFKQQKQF